MMGTLERVNRLERSRLSSEFYFSSLLEEAVRLGLLSGKEAERIQLECLELLAKRVERYTGGDSCSVRVEVAESILQSSLYTMGVYLKSLPSPDDAVRVLASESMASLYANGRERIDSKLTAAKDLHHAVMVNLLKTANHAYTSTVVGGIRGFFKLYDADFEAQEIHITADYPLCNPVSGLTGIEFMEQYLRSIYDENSFCRYFAPEAIHHLLCGYDERYPELLFNIFEQVLTGAIGCVLVGNDARGLKLSGLQVEQLYALLSEKDEDGIRALLDSACRTLVGELGITSPSLRLYMKQALSPILSAVLIGVKTDRLERVFIPPKYPERHIAVRFSWGEKMDNEKYRRLVGEIRECRFVEDKLEILRREVRSLADLEDVLLDAELTAEEILFILNAILEKSDMEIAALAGRYLYAAGSEEDERESEKTLRLCLQRYIHSLSSERQHRIAEMMKTIPYDE